MAVKMGWRSLACCSGGLANSSCAETRIADGRLSSLAILQGEPSKACQHVWSTITDGTYQTNKDNPTNGVWL